MTRRTIMELMLAAAGWADDDARESAAVIAEELEGLHAAPRDARLDRVHFLLCEGGVLPSRRLAGQIVDVLESRSEDPHGLPRECRRTIPC